MVMVARRSYVVETVANRRDWCIFCNPAGSRMTTALFVIIGLQGNSQNVRQLGYTVFEELRGPPSTSFIKPDLIAVRDRRATVIDVSIFSDGREVTVWNEKNYGADEYSIAIISVLHAIGYGVDFLVHQPMIISYRGSAFLNSLRLIRLTERMRRSHTPPLWLLNGGVNCHSTLYRISSALMRECESRSMARFNSISAPTKLEPLSLIIFSGAPLRAIKRISALMKESEDNEWAISRCTALICKQASVPLERLLLSIFSHAYLEAPQR
ncbi:hypothetical protein T265_01247 [Opisthorchis viverrini]|uniref:Uncharacterized protein n=1 Tax=Opisthorchis viverrini TaxID=6198 RepID=A0A075AJ49_OPIVI|nr:hypothetical protein T265_01247 [Opisthorchis viverrini]KER32764.1 hypothetical protein T265_01247 [Opisthorchis viverrini]